MFSKRSSLFFNCRTFVTNNVVSSIPIDDQLGFYIQIHFLIEKGGSTANCSSHFTDGEYHPIFSVSCFACE